MIPHGTKTKLLVDFEPFITAFLVDLEMDWRIHTSDVGEGSLKIFYWDDDSGIRDRIEPQTLRRSCAGRSENYAIFSHSLKEVGCKIEKLVIVLLAKADIGRVRGV